MIAEVNLDFNNISAIKDNGFTGFISVDDLWKENSHIPKIKGVYLVLDSNGKPDFIIPGVGGYYKGKDPNVSLSELNSNWVPDSLVVYIGKAGGSKIKETLHSRLGTYLRFGQGKKASHWGGRYIWQLRNHKDLLFCWKPTPNEVPIEVEKLMIDNFVMQYSKKPFANLPNRLHR